MPNSYLMMKPLVRRMRSALAELFLPKFSRRAFHARHRGTPHADFATWRTYVLERRKLLGIVGPVRTGELERMEHLSAVLISEYLTRPHSKLAVRNIVYPRC